MTRGQPGHQDRRKWDVGDSKNKLEPAKGSQDSHDNQNLHREQNLFLCPVTLMLRVACRRGWPPRAAELGWEKLQGVWRELADPQSQGPPHGQADTVASLPAPHFNLENSGPCSTSRFPILVSRGRCLTGTIRDREFRGLQRQFS